MAVGLGVGLVAGAVLALLFAPQSGEETRAYVKEKAKVAVDKAKTIRDNLGKFKKGE